MSLLAPSSTLPRLSEARPKQSFAAAIRRTEPAACEHCRWSPLRNTDVVASNARTAPHKGRSVLGFVRRSLTALKEADKAWRLGEGRAVGVGELAHTSHAMSEVENKVLN